MVSTNKSDLAGWSSYELRYSPDLPRTKTSPAGIPPAPVHTRKSEMAAKIETEVFVSESEGI
jgi:hypothetical protein